MIDTIIEKVKNADLLKYETNMKYKTMSKKEKDKKKKFQRERYHVPEYNEHLKRYQKIYDKTKKIFCCIKDESTKDNIWRQRNQ